jgi:hypothetical protein
VEERNVWTSVALMALVGGALALLCTERGRQSLRKVEMALDDFGDSLQEIRGAVQKAGLVATQGLEVAHEGKDAVSHLIGKTDRRPGTATFQ